MTEKKKRGRPKKINPILQQAAKDIEFVKPKYFESPMVPIVEAMDRAMREKRLTPLFISNPEKIKASDIFDFPTGWDKMGKVDRLKWLKEQNAKK